MIWANKDAASRSLPPLGLLLLALSTAFVFGNDRGHFYRPGHHDWVSSEQLAITANLSPEHRLLMFQRKFLDGDTVIYEPYNRFPVGGYLLLKLAALPFTDDLSATIYAARMLMLLFFAAAAVLAYLAILRLIDSTSNRWIALTATLLTFSSPYCLYYNDMVHPKMGMDLFGIMLTFHGMVVFLQEGRFRQLLVKACLALLLGWHVFALLLTFIILGVVSELIRTRSAGPDHAIRRRWMACALTPLVGRYVALGAVTLLVGVSILTFNFVNEWLALNHGGALAELPSFKSMLWRTGVLTAQYSHFSDFLAWPQFLEKQFSRIGGGIALPFSMASRINEVAATSPPSSWSWTLQSAIIGYVMWAGCLASLIGLAFVRRPRHRLPLATLALWGFCWSLPMRFNVAFHEFETLFYLGIPLVLFSLVLLGVRRLAGGRAMIGLAIAALLVFVFSAYEMSRIGHDGEAADFQQAMAADFETIREITAGKSVVAATQFDPPAAAIEFVGARQALHYYLAGSFVQHNGDLDLGDFLVTRNRASGIATLTPDNRVMHLYDTASLSEAYRSAYRSIRMGEPVSRSHFDLYLHDPEGAGARRLSYVKEPCGITDRWETFFLTYIKPGDLGNIAEDRAEHGFEARTFNFYKESGLASRGTCMVTIDLPDYEIASITTGQLIGYIPGEDKRWEVSFSPSTLSTRQTTATSNRQGVPKQDG